MADERRPVLCISCRRPMRYVRDAQAGELVAITCDGEGCPYNLHGKVVGGVTGPAVTTIVLQPGVTNEHTANELTIEERATLDLYLKAAVLGEIDSGTVRQVSRLAVRELVCLRAAVIELGEMRLVQPSDLDAFRAMLERGGKRFTHMSRIDYPDTKDTGKSVVAVPTEDPDVRIAVSFDELGAFERIGVNSRYHAAPTPDLDLFRAMLERAGIEYQRPRETEIVVGSDAYTVFAYFDASGALKRVDGGA